MFTSKIEKRLIISIIHFCALNVDNFENMYLKINIQLEIMNNKKINLSKI